MEQTLKDRLKCILKGKVLIIGVGNTLKSDDGFGPILTERLQGKVAASIINAGIVPENYISKVSQINPDVVVIVDVANLGKQPGTIEILAPQQLSKINSVSTHGLPIKMFIELISSEAKTDVFLLAVQPKTLKLKEELSPELLERLEDLEANLQDILIGKK